MAAPELGSAVPVPVLLQNRGLAGSGFVTEPVTSLKRIFKL